MWVKNTKPLTELQLYNGNQKQEFNKQTKQNTMNTRTTTATKRITEWSSLGMTNESIIDLVNGLMCNKINSDNMLLCLEIKRQLNN